MSELTAEQVINAAIVIIQMLADTCPQNEFVEDWEGCEELDNQGNYDETDGRCSSAREGECWRRYLCQEAKK